MFGTSPASQLETPQHSGVRQDQQQQPTKIRRSLFSAQESSTDRNSMTSTSKHSPLDHSAFTSTSTNSQSRLTTGKREISSEEKGLSSSSGDELSPVRHRQVIDGVQVSPSLQASKAHFNSMFAPESSLEEDQFSPTLVTYRHVFEYTTLKEIGDGDFGYVSEVIYDIDGQHYAVKASKRPAISERDLQHQLQEVYALSSCFSPYILRYYDAWIEGEKVFIRTEVLQGGSAKQLPNPLPEECLWDLLLQVALGLSTMHHAGIAHLDIKPDNILCSSVFDPNDIFCINYKIGDFGLARPVNSGRTVVSLDGFAGINDDEGDCRYLCPRFLAQGYTNHLKEADMYSLGASLYDLMGGNPNSLRRCVGASPEHCSVMQREEQLQAALYQEQESSVKRNSQGVPLPFTYSPLLRQIMLQLTMHNPLDRLSAFDVIRQCRIRLSKVPSWVALQHPQGEGDCQVETARELVFHEYETEIQELQRQLRELKRDSSAADGNLEGL